MKRKTKVANANKPPSPPIGNCTTAMLKTAQLMNSSHDINHN